MLHVEIWNAEILYSRRQQMINRSPCVKQVSSEAVSRELKFVFDFELVL